MPVEDNKPNEKVDTYQFTLMIIRETEKAWLLTDGTSLEEWFPKSQCELEMHDYDLQEGDFLIPEWLAKKKGLI